MMFCAQCGAQLSEDARFCQNCGTKVDEVSEANDSIVQNVNSSQEETSVLEESATQDKSDPEFNVTQPIDISSSYSSSESAVSVQQRSAKTSRWHNLAILGGVVLGVAVLVMALVAVGHDGQIQFFPWSTPDITEERIREDLESYVSDDLNELSASQWASNSGYQLTDMSIEDRENSDYETAGTGEKIHQQSITASAVYENSSFRVSVDQFAVYSYLNDEWVLQTMYPVSGDIEPIGGIDDDTLLNNAWSIIFQAEPSAGTDNDGDSVYLSDVYDDDRSVELVENATDASGGTATFAISNVQGFCENHGEVTVQFSWNGSDWEITGGSVSEESYLDDYSSLIGTWTGTLKSNSSYRKSCYGGRSQPLKFEITDVDSTTKTLAMNITVLVHDHKYLSDSAADSTSGDTYYTIDNVTASFSIGGNSEEIYDSELWSDDATIPYWIQVNLSVRADGTMTASTKTGKYIAKNAGFLYEFYDNYTMTKSE